MQEEFEEAFPFTETPGQLKAIEDVKRDMESGKVMDRLVCGDVGYGKTEVAIRAAFKAIMDGKASCTFSSLQQFQQSNIMKDLVKDLKIIL